MRCHFHTDEHGVKHLIPGCWGVVTHYHLPDKEALEWCECPKPQRKSDKEVIRELREENKRLKERLNELGRAATKTE
ncbi:hypothetical protein [Chitinophaga japonensis]|uniref:Uncharacterized protein n=1 Tax=Chitinophaga japonensis TaxID=104662 RepID=A0A562SZ33_CHIJA|nr:hypothetical protein [Chitinophaga japonensis]TWI86318.1 hypothetical protein LX66_3572 [Chitinophaga japonensis]